MPSFARKPSNMNYFFPAEVPPNSKFPTPSTFSCWNFRIQKPRKVLVPVLTSEAMLWITEDGDGRFGGRFLNHRAQFEGENHFPNFLDAGRENCFCSEQNHPEFLHQEKGQSGGTESSKRGPFLSWKTSLTWSASTSGLLEPMIPSRIIQIYLQLFLRNDDIQGIRYEMGWNSIIYDEDSIGWHPGKFVHIKNTWIWSTQNRHQNCIDMEIHQKIWRPNYRKLKTMVKRSTDQKLRLRNFDARHGKIETGESRQESKEEEVLVTKWREQGQCSKGDQCSFPAWE